MRNKVNIAICAIIKNEADNIREWIEFHKLVGVDRFYLYNNESSDNLTEILKTYIESGEVVYHYIGLRPGQLPAYTHYIQAYRTESVWTAFIDADEFLFGTIEDNLCNILDKYVEYDGLAVNWLNFGTSGHLEKQSGLVIENYTKRSLDDYIPNKHIKSIIKTAKAVFVVNPHVFITQNGKCVDENYNLMNGSHETVMNSVKVIRINHYVTKSVEEVKAKWLQGRADVNTQRDWGFFERRINQNDVEDLCISRFISPLKVKLNLKKLYQSNIFNALK